MIIYLCCEGATDYAVIPPLMKKAADTVEMDVHWIKRSELKKITFHRKKNVAISARKKMIKALAITAERDKVSYIAYHNDADRKHTEIYNEIISEFNELKKFHCIAIVPKEMTESWLLADESAYPAIPKNPKLPSKPEEIWGQIDDKESNHPYNYFVRVLNQFKLPDNRDTYSRIAENTNIEILKQRCQVSFGKFYIDIRDFIETAITQ
jgi:coenzyme F420-reducing hydrogenase delta subunit